MMVALKAQWAVHAGLIPGEDMAEYTRGWQYTSQDFAKDGNKIGTRWSSMASEAHFYARELEVGGCNHVRVEYLWL
jgi:hypothetical protein